MEKITRLSERAQTERDTLDSILDAATVGVLATVVDGCPRTVPMLYGRVGDDVFLHGSTGAGTLRELADGKPASLCVTLVDGLVFADNLFNSSANYRSAVVRGVATQVGPDEAATALTAMSDKLFPGRSAEVADHTRKELAATVVLRLPIADGQWTAKVRNGPPGRYDLDPEAWVGVVPTTSGYGTPVPAPWMPADRPLPASVRGLIEG